MAVKTWKGATGDWNLGSNWIGGVAPGAGDIAVCDRESQVIDTNLSAIAAILELRIKPGYTGQIGAPANLLTCSVTGKIVHEGVAPLWFADAAGTTGDVYIAAANNAVVVHLGGNTITRIMATRGNVTLDSTLGTVALTEIGYIANQANDVVFDMQAGGTLTDCIVDGGNFTLNGTATTIKQTAGRIIQPVGGVGVATTILQGGGVYRHLNGVNVTRLHAHGTFELGSVAKTITTAYFGPRAQVIGYDSSVQTYTNAPIDLRNVGQAA